MRSGVRPKYLKRSLAGAEAPKSVEANELVLVTQPLVPALLDGCLDAHTRSFSEHGIAIGLRLLAEQLEARNDTTAASIPLFARRSAAAAASPTSEPVAISVTSRLPLGLAQDIAALGGLVLGRAVCAGSAPPVAIKASTEGVSVAWIAISQHSAVSTPSAGRSTSRFGMARNAARCSIGWCVGPSSPTPIDFVRHDVDDALLHQRGEADRRAAVIREHEERAAVRDEAAVKGEAVHRGGHAVLADAVVDVVAGEVAALDGLLVVFGLGAVGAGEVGGAADQLRQRRKKLFERQLRPDSGRALGSVGRERRPWPRRIAASTASARGAPAGRASAILAVSPALRRLTSRPYSRAAPRSPKDRHAFRICAGISNGAAAQPNFSRAPAISAGSVSGAVRSRCLPALVGAP